MRNSYFGFYSGDFCDRKWLIQREGLRNIHGIFCWFRCDPCKCSRYGAYLTDRMTKNRGSNSKTGKNFFFLYPQVHPASYAVGTGCDLRKCSSLVAKLTTYFHVAIKLRMSRPVPLLPVCLHGVHKDNFTFSLPYWLLWVSTSVNSVP